MGSCDCPEHIVGVALCIEFPSIPTYGIDWTAGLEFFLLNWSFPRVSVSAPVMELHLLLAEVAL